jgi:sulfatase maturation enzyme AslB (radical SAM superfamily)
MRTPLAMHHRQVVLSRDLDGRTFAFVPLLCRLYSTSEPEVSALLPDSKELLVVDASTIPALESEILTEIETRGLEALHRRHTPGIAIILTQQCNLSCSYCLAKQGTFGLPVNEMSFKDVKKWLSDLFSRNPTIDFVKFFGGEPTLRFDLIRSICDFISSEIGRLPHFAITTNGTLNAARHLDLWKQFHFSVSVSIDGPAQVHDEVRTTRAGHGSFKKAVEYCSTLRDANFPFAVVGVFDDRHRRHGLTYLDTIRFLNSLSPLVKVQFVEALGDAVEREAAVQFDFLQVREEVRQAVDMIFNLATSNWLSPDHPDWVYDNNLFRFMYGVSTGKARPYEHACTASNLTTLFPSGQSMPCYTFSGHKELSLGNLNAPGDSIEVKRQQFQDSHTWEYMAQIGTGVPWYRGIVGDICVADMMNNGGERLESSPFYKQFQQSAVTRILQHLAALPLDPIKHARFLVAMEAHAAITGLYSAKMQKPAALFGEDMNNDQREGDTIEC